MKIISWNVNSVRKRLSQVLALIADEKPDALLLQELKCTTEDFPLLEIQNAGYQTAIHGQKGFNGVAILSPHPISNIVYGLPPFTDDMESRYVEATINGITVASVYVPNGQEVGSDKYSYKLKFYDYLTQHIKVMLATENSYILGGDFNVVDQDIDVYDADRTRGRILCSQPEKNVLRQIMHTGMIDSYRTLYPAKKEFSWWDYRDGSFAQDKGMRIDYIFAKLTQKIKLQNAAHLQKWRSEAEPSDHCPVSCFLSK